MTKKSKDFSDFMISEYAHISEAHFQSSNQISLFFRYYLIVMSAPILLFLAANNDFGFLEAILNNPDKNKWLVDFSFYFFIIIAILGFLICMYISMIKFDNILYARTVNGIRKYFSDSETKSQKYLKLPLSLEKPKYFTISFLLIIIAMGITNSSYLFLSFLIYKINCSFIYIVMFFTLHILMYYILTIREDKKFKNA